MIASTSAFQASTYAPGESHHHEQAGRKSSACSPMPVLINAILVAFDGRGASRESVMTETHAMPGMHAAVERVPTW